jgi:hypothetical protein
MTRFIPILKRHRKIAAGYKRDSFNKIEPPIFETAFRHQRLRRADMPEIF